jgi:DNA-binding transcriptional regulator LsrR (DeoR family)
MYHERGIRQTDIADTLHISQARVSRFLKRAAELGIVRTVVAVAPGLHTEVEEALEEKCGLTETVVVNVEGTDEEIIAGLGSAGATYLETTLTGGERIGISSWSQTLLALVDRMRPFRVPGADSVISSWEASATHQSRPKAIGRLPNLLDSLGLPPPSCPLLLSLVTGPYERAC